MSQFSKTEYEYIRTYTDYGYGEGKKILARTGCVKNILQTDQYGDTNSTYIEVQVHKYFLLFKRVVTIWVNQKKHLFKSHYREMWRLS